LALSLLALTACGDSLVGGDFLEELLGLQEFPTEVAWELRWYQGPDAPLLVECGLREPHTGMAALEEILFGVAEVPPPVVEEVPEAGTLIEGEGYAYGIALLVLMEPAVYHDADPERESVALDPSRGTWGVVDEFVVLVADGEPDALRWELMVEPEDGVIEPGVQLVEFLPEVVLGTGSFAGSIFPIEPEEQDFIWEVGLPAVHLDYLEGYLWEVFEGLPMGGAERQPCEDF
jgi:hypothetical protein